MLHLLYYMLQMYRNYALALIGALCLLSCNKEQAPDPVVEKYHFALADAETTAAVKVDADASGSYTWTIEAAVELTDLETSVSLDGTPVTDGVAVQKLAEGGLTITVSYAANDSFVPKVWTVSVSTQNSNVEVQLLTMTLTQDCQPEEIVNETFKTSQGAFTVNNIALASKLADKGVWKHNAAALGGVMVGNLYLRGNSETSKARFESPEFSLKGKSEYATLSFMHDGKYVNDDIYKVQYTVDGGETWNDATIVGDAFLPDKVDGKSREWKLMDATVDLSAALGAEKVKFGFYIEGKDMTWEFNSLVLKAK